MLSVRDRARLSLAASALRVILFVVLLGGGLMAEQYRAPQDGSLARLYEDVRDQRVDVIEYRYHVSGKSYDLVVRWSTGPFSWWEHQESGDLGPVPQEIRQAFPDGFAGPQGSEFDSDLRRAVGHQKIDIRPYLNEQRHQTFWIRGLPEGWRGVSVKVVALALLGLMLMTRDHRYANRWAWFWMFTNPLGMLGYLWLEKRPFPPPRPSRAQAPIGGGVGFCYSIGLSILFWGITALADHLMQPSPSPAEIKDTLRTARIHAFLGTGMHSRPSIALIVTALADARRAVTAHQSRDQPVNGWPADEVRFRGIRENAAVLAVLEIPERREETVESYLRQHPDRAAELNEFLAVLE